MRAKFFFLGLITGGLMVGGCTAGYFTRWAGSLPFACIVVGSFALVIGLLWSTIEDDQD